LWLQNGPDLRTGEIILSRSEPTTLKYDVIIIGTGIAGLFCADMLEPHKRVLLISKNEKNDCNTYWAQGGIATALNHDDITSHIADTLEAGAGKSDVGAVEILVKESLEVVPRLIELGVPFDRDEAGELLYTREGAHSTNRIIHAGGDATGRVIHEALMHITRSDIMDQTTVIDLLFEGHVCHGVCVERNGVMQNVYADNVVIAAGGVGSLFAINTNAKGITGDLHGIVLQHGFQLQDMHLLQFHPTVFVESDGPRKLLLTEALRGEGARIVDEDGYEFLYEYHEQGPLAPRDVVARAIFLHRMKTHKTIYLDLSHFDPEWFEKRFPTVCGSLRDVGINVPSQKVRISPALHYSMGGIRADLDSRVHGSQNLYVIGEAASNRVHGANRLASNSLLEGLVFGKIAAESILERNFKTPERTFKSFGETLMTSKDAKIIEELSLLMWKHAGVIRRGEALKQARDKVSSWLKDEIGWMLRLRLLTAQAIIEAALGETTSVGAHYLVDE